LKRKILTPCFCSYIFVRLRVSGDIKSYFKTQCISGFIWRFRIFMASSQPYLTMLCFFSRFCVHFLCVLSKKPFHSYFACYWQSFSWIHLRQAHSKWDLRFWLHSEVRNHFSPVLVSLFKTCVDFKKDCFHKTVWLRLLALFHLTSQH